MAELKHAQMTDKTLFLGVPVRMFPKEISIWIDRTRKDMPSPMTVNFIQSAENQNRLGGEKMNSLLLFDL
jgi:hypothetical protein